jgi:hypothetical protein
LLRGFDDLPSRCIPRQHFLNRIAFTELRGQRRLATLADQRFAFATVGAQMSNAQSVGAAERNGDRGWRSALWLGLTVVAAAALFAARHAGFEFPAPGIPLLMTVFFATLGCGLGPGIVCAMITICAGVLWLSEPGRLFEFTPDHWRRFQLLLACAAVLPPLTAYFRAQAVGRIVAEEALRVRAEIADSSTAIKSSIASLSARIDAMRGGMFIPSGAALADLHTEIAHLRRLVDGLDRRG